MGMFLNNIDCFYLSEAVFKNKVFGAEESEKREKQDKRTVK